MSDLIDKKVLYNRFVDLEAIALEQVKKHMCDEDLTEWRIWSTILAERTAYKHDVFNAPVVYTDPTKHGHWIRKDYDIECSECHARIDERDLRWAIDTEAKYCLNCGCKMDKVTEDDADA